LSLHGPQRQKVLKYERERGRERERVEPNRNKKKCAQLGTSEAPDCCRPRVLEEDIRISYAHRYIWPCGSVGGKSFGS
jgi:hypothetical protein